MPPKPGDKAKARKAGKKNRLFASILDEKGTLEPGAAAAVEASTADLERLLDAVHESGERLKADVSLARIQEYKQAVRNFIRTVVEFCFAMEEHALPRKQKRYALLSIIDEKLERLAAEVMAGQRSQLEILRRVDEINGFLVDLLR